MTQQTIFTVCSSNGAITAEYSSGIVTEVNSTDEKSYIEDISRFDMDEWRKYYNGDDFPSSIDILDLGFWNKDGSYEEPAFDWRLDRKALREEAEKEFENKRGAKVEFLYDVFEKEDTTNPVAKKGDFAVIISNQLVSGSVKLRLISSSRLLDGIKVRELKIVDPHYLSSAGLAVMCW